MYYNCYVKVIERVERKDRVMRCEKCPQYRSEPLWNRCEITGAECFYTVDNCDLVDDDGNDDVTHYALSAVARFLLEYDETMMSEYESKNYKLAVEQVGDELQESEN